jgi:hypothetical protein
VKVLEERTGEEMSLSRSGRLAAEANVESFNKPTVPRIIHSHISGSMFRINMIMQFKKHAGFIHLFNDDVRRMRRSLLMYMHNNLTKHVR